MVARSPTGTLQRPRAQLTLTDAVVFLAERLAQFAVDARLQSPPAGAIVAAQHRLLDGLGVAMAALRSRDVVRSHATFKLFGAGGTASAIGRARPCATAAATLHNGLLMHGLEFDDTHVAGVVHGAPVVLPAVVAYAEQMACTGADVLRAICIGWEVLARIGSAMRGELQQQGFQATSVAGPLAAAAAVSYLAGFDVRRTSYALGIAGSQSSGVFEFLGQGATSKALHGGWASLAGLVAASLAADGMTGPTSILEGERGIFLAFGRSLALATRMEDAFADLGARWAVSEARPKTTPCCHYIQAFIEALDSILSGGVDPGAIQRIQCVVDPRQADLICKPWQDKLIPVSGYAAKWSLPFCLAARAILGQVDVDLFENPFPLDVMAFAQRIDWSAREDGFPDRYPGHLIVTLVDGRVVESYVPDVLGSLERPFPRDLLLRKFRAAASGVLSFDAASGLLNEVVSLERASSLESLGGFLRGAHDSISQSVGNLEPA